MEKAKEKKVKHIDIRVSATEYEDIHKQFKKSIYRKLADYARKVLLAKPIVSKYRNQSLDDFMTEVVQLRNELNAVGNNFNQAVRKLNMLNENGSVRHWVMAYEADKNNVLVSIEKIEKSISKFADQWLQ